MATIAVLDLEGTLYTREGPIEGAASAIVELRDTCDALRFLTNTDSHSNESLIAAVTKLGLDIRPSELFTPVNSVVSLLDHEPQARVYALTTAEVRDQLSQSCVMTDDPLAATHVVVGEYRHNLDYSTLNNAFHALMNGGQLVGLQKGRYFLAGGQPQLDSGAAIAALEYASGQTAQIIGKPTVTFLEAALASIDQPIVDRSNVWVVGDDATTDIAMGNAYGATTVQVATGKYSAEVGRGSADHLISSIADLPSLLS